jgi:hypothetical protein
MRIARWRMRLLAGALLTLVGCQGPETIKPPLHEEYILPPADDARFSSPPTYPKEVLDTEQFKKEKPKTNDPTQMPKFGGPGGAGGPGMGGY